MTARVGHWKRDPCTLYIARGSKWGNPYAPHGMAKRSKFAVIEVDDPLAAYEAHVRRTPDLMQSLLDLEGHALGCFCVRLDDPLPTCREDERCHGHVLIRLLREVARCRACGEAEPDPDADGLCRDCLFTRISDEAAEAAFGGSTR